MVEARDRFEKCVAITQERWQCSVDLFESQVRGDTVTSRWLRGGNICSLFNATYNISKETVLPNAKLHLKLYGY